MQLWSQSAALDQISFLAATRSACLALKATRPASPCHQAIAFWVLGKEDSPGMGGWRFASKQKDPDQAGRFAGVACVEP